MKRDELDFTFPPELLATERAARSRIMMVVASEPHELAGGIDALVDSFRPGDLLLINDTRVLRRRVFSEAGLEILFLRPLSATDWEVLCPSSRWKADQILPGGVRLEMRVRGRPQTVRVHAADGDERQAANPPELDDAYFLRYGDLPLPPYIQKARGERRNRLADQGQYQSQWADVPGSLAAPTASLHFSQQHLQAIEARGARVARLTLHVGLGTFLPVTAENLNDHVMHAETVSIPAATWRLVEETRAHGGRIWALGTTVARSVESAARGLLPQNPYDAGGYFGETSLFIRPGFEFQVVDVLCTNFHQPQSTLLALVAAFAGLETVKRCYQWAIERRFRLFSYGDLTVWMQPNTLKS